MDASRAFFSKLRSLALTLEKEVKQLEQALRNEDAVSEDETSASVLHDLHCEVETLKEDINASCAESCSRNQAIHEFMKASEILIQRNAADLGKIREQFQKYVYKPPVKDSTVSDQNKSDEEKANDLPACTEKPLLPKNPLHSPQLSDFGLSHYAFSRPWSAVKTQHITSAYQQKSKNETPVKTQTPRTWPKTPKCRLKMDGYEFATPKLEHFGISEHTMCMNEDYTTSLIQKTAQTLQKEIIQKPRIVFLKTTLKILLILLIVETKNQMVSGICNTSKAKLTSKVTFFKTQNLRHIHLSEIYKMVYDNGGDVPEMTAREIMVSSVPKSNVRAENADWMASPMAAVFCTPDVKVSSKTNTTVLPRSLETKQLPLPSHTATPQCPDFQTSWLKTEAKVVNSNYVHFHTLCHKQFLKVSFGILFQYWGKIESVTKSDAKDKQYRDSTPFAVSPDAYLKHLGDPSPPTIKHYDQLLNTPPPPEITKIPDDVLQILSKYNHKVGSSKAKEMEIKAGSTPRCESDSTDYCNKENR
ncbi:SKA3 protein, partial [Cephalopterus ornatus]|nr:SKA3 protein [Cephalopterus ornatus]